MESVGKRSHAVGYTLGGLEFGAIWSIYVRRRSAMMKVGDKVLYDFSNRRIGAGMMIETIIRETPTQWITKDSRGNESKWHKKDLRLVGTKSDPWAGCPSIEPLTPEALARFNAFGERLKRKRIMKQIRELDTPDIPSTRLQEILDELQGKEVKAT